MKRTVCIFLFAILVLGLAGCAGTADSWDNGAAIDGSFSAAEAVEEVEALCAAVSAENPGKKVITLIRQSYSGGVYPADHNRALNEALDELGYDYVLAVYTLGDQGLFMKLTFTDLLEEYLAAGGRCDVIAAGANILNLAGFPGDTVWDYVDRGLITPVEELVSESDLERVAELYGEAFLKQNEDNGVIYGFSPAALEGVELSGYFAVSGYRIITGFGDTFAEKVRNTVIVGRPAVVNAPGSEYSSTGNRAFISRLGSYKAYPYSPLIEKDCDVAILPWLTPEAFLNALLLDESYTQINMLPLYVRDTPGGPQVLAIWEVPGYEETVSNYLELVKAGHISLSHQGGQSGAFYFESYPDPLAARADVDNYLSLTGAENDYSLIPLHQTTVVNGPECSLFVCSAAGDKALAGEFALSALTDGALGGLLSMGVPGVAYSEENGVRTELLPRGDILICPNALFTLPLETELASRQELIAQMAREAEFDLYENFNPDLGGAEEEAKALAAWAIKYRYSLQSADPDAESFFLSKKYPEIGKLKEEILRQLEEYDSIYR